MEVIIKRFIAGLLSAGLLLVSQTALAAVQTVATGTVTSDQGGALAGIPVECHTGNGSFTTTAITDGSGAYVCSSDTATLNVGDSVTVEVHNPPEGYNSPMAQAFTWDGSTAGTYNFVLITAGYTVNVTVHDTAGNPIVADVIVQPIKLIPGQDATQASGATDETTGTDSIGVSFPDGIVLAEANLSEQNPDRYPWVGIGGAQEVHFSDTVTSVDLDFTVVKSVTKVSVKMVDASGNILTQNNFSGDVYFEGYNDTYGSVSTRRKVNSATGIAEVYLLPGVWRVSAMHQQLQDQSYDPAETTFVVTDTAGTTDWGTIQAVNSTGMLSGTATLEEAAAPASTDFSGVTVEALNLDTNSRYSGNMQPDGSFSLQHMALGTYTVTLTGNDVIPTQTGSAQITSQQTTVSNISIAAQRANQTISGVLTDSTGAAVKNFEGTVVVETPTGESSAAVNSYGTYSVPLYTAGLTGDDASLRLVTQAGADGYAQTEQFTISQNNSVLDLTLQTDEGTITGNVQDQTGSAVGVADLGDAASVMAINTTTGSVETALVADDGSYSLAVGPGTWNLVPQINDASANVYASSMSGAAVKVTAGDTSEKNIKVLEETATITGTITDADGQAIPEAPVTITNLPALQAQDSNVKPSQIISITTTANAAGEVDVDVPAGTYTLSFGTTPDVTGETAPASEAVVVTNSQDANFSAAFQDNSNTELQGDINGDFDYATVTAYSSDGGSETTDVSKDGNYSLSLAPGDWDIVASGVKNDELFVQQSSTTVTDGTNDKNFTPQATGIDFPAAISVSGDADEVITVSNSAGASVNLPAYAAAFSGTVTVTLTPAVSFTNTSDMSQLALAYDVRVVDDEGIPVTTLNKDVTVTLPLEEQLKSGVSDNEITASYYNADLGTNLFDGIASDVKNDTVVIQTEHLSRFAATTTGNVTFLPTAVKTHSLQASHISSTSALLAWKKPTGSTVTRYKLQVRKKGVTNKTKWKKYSVTKTKKVVTNLVAKTNYQFHVQACNASGCGSFSDWKKFKTN
ncbi:MAG: fibronectin type III domain-containing protein [Patescibacteria group bacterium]|jgi:hypothetical protein